MDMKQENRQADELQAEETSESLLQMAGSMEKPAAAENVQGPANEMHDLAGPEPKEKQKVGGIVFPAIPVGVVKELRTKPSAQTTRPLSGYQQQHWEIPLKDYMNAIYSSAHWGMRNPQLTRSSTWDSGVALRFMMVADASQRPRGKWETQTMMALNGAAGWSQRSWAASGEGKEELVQGLPVWPLTLEKWEQKVLGLLGEISVNSLIPELDLPYSLKMEAKQEGDKDINLLGGGHINENETLQLEGLEQIYFTGTSRGKETMILQAPEKQDSYGSQLGLEGGAQFDPMRRDCLLEEQSFRKAISLGREMKNPECGKSSGLLTNLPARRKKETYVCSVCGKSFSYKGNLIKHERIHTGEKLCTCLECGKTFCDRSYFLVHQRKHASEKGYGQ